MEHSFICPFCGEEISMVLDLSVRRHTYVEDWEVGCNPLEISYTVEDDSLARGALTTKRIGRAPTLVLCSRTRGGDEA